MADLNNNFDLETEDTPFSERAITWFKSNVVYMLVAALCGVYLFSGILNLTPNTNYQQIAAMTIIGAMVGWFVKALLGRQGITNAMMTKTVKDTKANYENKVHDNDEYCDYYQAFCDIVNVEKIRNYQVNVLSTVNLKYSKFIAGEYDNSKTYKNIRGVDVKFTRNQRKALHRARNPKVIFISPDYLTNEATISGNKEARELTPKQYEAKRNTQTALSAVAITLLFCYFGVQILVNWSWANFIWSGIQVFLYLTWGTMEYFMRYSWVLTDHLRNIKKRVDYLNRFNKMVANRDQLLFAKINEMQLIETAEGENNDSKQKDR